MMHYPKTQEEWLKLRHQNISSTESAALFGLGAYQTPYELGVSKREKEPPPALAANERMRWGTRLQEAVARGISEDYGVKVRRVTGYAVHADSRLGASFDYEIVGINPGDVEDISLQQMYRDLGPGVLEIKNVDRWIFNREWKKTRSDDLSDTSAPDIEAPAHIEIQVQHQLEAIGTRKWSAIAALVGGNETYLILRDYDPEFGAKIRARVDEFWKDLDAGKLPPVLLPQDVDIIRKVYLGASKGKLYNGSDDKELTQLVKEYMEAKDLRDVHEGARKSAQAKILMRIQDAESAVCPGYRLATGSVSAAVIPEHTRKPYRMLRITEVKQHHQGEG